MLFSSSIQISLAYQGTIVSYDLNYLSTQIRRSEIPYGILPRDLSSVPSKAYFHWCRHCDTLYWTLIMTEPEDLEEDLFADL